MKYASNKRWVFGNNREVSSIMSGKVQLKPQIR